MRAITTAEAATWEDGAYLDLLAQYLGDTTSYASAPAMELELLRSSLELNVWHAPDKFDDTYVIQTGALTTSDSPVVSQIATSWPEGKTTVSLPGQDFPFATRATSTSTTRFTVVLGGTSHAGSTPKIVVTVQTLCVALE